MVDADDVGVSPTGRFTRICIDVADVSKFLAKYSVIHMPDEFCQKELWLQV